jgi:hypothetical protein
MLKFSMNHFARRALLTALPVSVLAACGGGGSSGGSTPPTTPPAPTYTVGGSVSGLSGTLVLRNNGGNDLTLTTNGAFTFSTALLTGATYAVTVATPPSGQLCNVTNAGGPIASANITNVSVVCAAIPPLAFVTSDPQSGGTDFLRSIVPMLTFDRPLDAATVTTQNVGFSSTVGVEPMTVGSTGSVLTITPARKLLPMTLYSITASTALRGSVGEVPASPVAVSFSTRDGIWQPAAPLRATPLPGGSRDETPRVVFDSSGNAMAVWPQSNGARRDLVASRFLPATGWSAPQLIEQSDAGDAVSPDIAVDANGNVTAVWRQYDGTRYNAWSSRFTTSGSAASWDTPSLIETGTGAVSGVEVAVNAAGTTIAIYGQSDGVRINLWANRYLNGAWGTPELIETNNATDVHDFDLAIDSQGVAIAVWRQHDGTRENIWSNRGSSGVWGTAELLETGSGTAFAPLIVMEPSGIAVAMWAQENGANRETIANRFASNAWGGIRVLDPTGSQIRNAVGFDATGRAHASWVCNHGGLRICISNFGVGGTAWSPLQQSAVLLDPSVGGLRITVDRRGHGMATWMAQDSSLNGSTPVYSPRPAAMRYLLGLGGWGVEEYLGDRETYSNTMTSDDTRLQSAVDQSGSVLVMYPNQAGALLTKRFE